MLEEIFKNGAWTNEFKIDSAGLNVDCSNEFLFFEPGFEWGWGGEEERVIAEMEGGVIVGTEGRFGPETGRAEDWLRGWGEGVGRRGEIERFEICAAREEGSTGGGCVEWLKGGRGLAERRSDGER